ncbi:hypothetical protein ET495_00090 [Xylanimonas allomyrinae]|uniref:Lipopolysaccharide biosynthesis protein n=1 Tax=Xylanimonas allomyrinae TaxID=2509459 RepID=A0A4P6EI26_9MICO|nr:hypothetical protein [Xylanimonas allomyrinae]QAY61965.1 hypothetical protein ET495_00090 [Xylanimonas allomyrinae]
MNARTVLHAVRHRWYVCALVCAAFAVFGVTQMQGGGTYYSKTAVWFSINMPPPLMPDSGADTPDVIAFAGAIATQLNNGRAPASYSSPDAPYYGAGVRQGVLVGIRDVGGQWANWFTRAVIDLQIVGPSEEWVTQQQDGLMARIQQAVHLRSAGSDEASPDTVNVQVEQFTQGVEHVEPSLVMRAMACAALGLAAILAGGLASVAADSAGHRITARRRPLTAANESTTESETSHP